MRGPSHKPGNHWNLKPYMHLVLMHSPVFKKPWLISNIGLEVLGQCVPRPCALFEGIQVLVACCKQDYY